MVAVLITLVSSVAFDALMLSGIRHQRGKYIKATVSTVKKKHLTQTVQMEEPRQSYKNIWLNTTLFYGGSPGPPHRSKRSNKETGYHRRTSNCSFRMQWTQGCWCVWGLQMTRNQSGKEFYNSLPLTNQENGKRGCGKGVGSGCSRGTGSLMRRSTEVSVHWTTWGSCCVWRDAAKQKSLSNWNDKLTSSQPPTSKYTWLLFIRMTAIAVLMSDGICDAWCK